MRAIALSLALLILSILGVNAVIGNENPTKTMLNDTSFADILGHKVRLATWRHPPGFLELLIREDHLDIIETDFDSYEITEANYFILFLKNWEELDEVPSFFDNVTKVVSAVHKEPKADFWFSRGDGFEGRKIQFIYINLGAFDDNSDDVVLCHAVNLAQYHMNVYETRDTEANLPDEFISDLPSELLVENCME